MWNAVLLAGLFFVATGLGIALFADLVSEWRARVYSEPASPPVFFATRGGAMALIGAVIAVLAFTRR
jgi:hypothetical protein